MSNALFYSLGLSFCLGIVGTLIFSIHLYHAMLLMLLGGVLGVIAFRSKTNSIVVSWSLCFCLAALGVVVTDQVQLDTTSLTQVASGSEVTFIGHVIQEPQQRERNTHVYVQNETGTILVYADRYLQVSYGDFVSAHGALVAPESFTTDLGRTFNYPGYLESKGVGFVMYYPEVFVQESGGGNPVFAALYSFKQQFRSALQEVLPTPHVALGEGLLLGVNGVLGEAWEEIFRTTGIIHIVVLSGYNIMLVVLFVQYALSFFLPYRARLVVGFSAIVLFAILVGLSATVVRASVMASILLLLRYFGNTYNVLRALAFAGFIMLLWNPLLLLYDPGFQLSFLATLGLILLAPHIERIVRFLPTMFNMREFVVATLATQVLVLPFLLYQIGEFSVVAIMVNVLVLPMVPVAMLLTFITGLLAMVAPTLALLVGVSAQLSLSYILSIASFFAALPFASFIVPAFPAWVMLLAYGFIGICIYYLYAGTAMRRPMRHWTIEEEAEVQKRVAASSQRDEAASVPVYFRSD